MTKIIAKYHIDGPNFWFMTFYKYKKKYFTTILAVIFAIIQIVNNTWNSYL